MSGPIRCILLIDDDPDDNFYHRIVIGDWGGGALIREAESGDEALQYLTAPQAPHYVRPDLILLDINMPGMNGFEFLAQYDTLPAHLKSHRLAILTTSPNPADRQRAAANRQVVGYYVKPLTPAVLQELARIDG